MEKARIPLMTGVLMFFSGVAMVTVYPGFIASWLTVLGAATLAVTLILMHASIRANR